MQTETQRIDRWLPRGGRCTQVNKQATKDMLAKKKKNGCFGLKTMEATTSKLYSEFAIM